MRATVLGVADMPYLCQNGREIVVRNGEPRGATTGADLARGRSRKG